MLETVDLCARLPKTEYREMRDALNVRLGLLQREALAAKIPVIIVFEGWLASGVGTVIGRLLFALDPRGYKLHTIVKPNEEAAMRPPLWRFWNLLPRYGAIGVFDGSWYWPLLKDKNPDLPNLCERTRIFERQLTDDGAVIVKYWLHVSKEEQAKRFKKLEKDPATAWRVTEADWRIHRRYDKYSNLVEHMLQQTSTAYAPCTIVPAHEQRFATVQVAETLAVAIENAIEHKKAAPPPAPKAERPPRRVGPLDRVNLDLKMDPARYERELSKLQENLRRLEHLIYTPRIPVVIVYEGWDASGKGGNIKRFISGLDHRGVEVVPVAAPEGEERVHHYLWRFWRCIPKGGHITVFDRSWYGRVMVERVEGFAKPAAWQRAYQEINEFDHELTSFGTVLVKFWIHLSKDEQLKRFKLREETPEKRWKITDEDWRNRKKWDEYHLAVSDMIEKTSTPNAPWTVIEGNDKPHARIKALRTIARAMEHALEVRGIKH